MDDSGHVVETLSWLARNRLGIPLEELDEAAKEREVRASLLKILCKRKKMERDP